jgi:hypothetical protein
LTPDAIRKRYTSDVVNSSLVIWRCADLERFGIRAGIDELAWELPRIDKIEFSFSRPAKGAGYLSLDVREKPGHHSKCAISADQFDAALLNWFRPLVTLLTDMFPGEMTERDEGYDV